MNVPKDLQNKAIILGVKIDDQPLEYFLEKTREFMASDAPHSVYTPNPEICLKAASSEEYKDTLNSADLNLPDGFGLKLGAKILGTDLKNRVTGADFTRELLGQNNSARVFVLLRNDSLTTLEDLKKFFDNSYPQVKLGCALSAKTPIADKVLLDKIKKHQTQVLFVCLGAPEQEEWIENNLGKGIGDKGYGSSVRIALGVGGSFDFLSGKIKRAPKLMQELGMEWLFRLYQEPKRLMRIKHATADFLLECHKWAKRIKTEYRANVLGVIKNKDGLYLIQENAHLPNHWQFPQGGVDKNENIEIAILREINEELGFELDKMKVVKRIKAEHAYISPKHYQLLHGYKGQKQIAFLVEYSGAIDSNQFRPNREVAAIKWVKKDELLKLLHPVRQEFTKKFIDEI
ncbi:MAG: Teichoic acid biosynthesis protein [Parcubacteria group bacterium GW2011_GWC2_39_14]|nr:MAG: Teichoic acid biosynthesis protein [Parcubacteria group bacterium GW2011_GWC2_39_14]KKR55388.1 MAG: Teichoic acid biosynthesis protein [Parcubacteria group bacterium GW2011_GWA2_40_23]